MKIVICDDNPQFGNDMLKFVQKTAMESSWYNDSFKIDYIQSSKNLVDYISKHDIDILFLDISMPEINGFDVAAYLNDNNIQTMLIFVSSFENNVFYSLRYKPFRFIRKEKYKEEIGEALKAAYIEYNSKNRFIMISKHGDAIPVCISRIIYAEKEKRSNYMVIYSLDDVYRYRGTVSDFEKMIQEDGFVKVSQNAFVNMNHIINIKNNTVFLKGNNKYFIAPKYQSEVISTFFKFMRE